MAIVKYILSEFDGYKATDGALCICVKKNVSVPGIIYSNSGDFIGAGMCTRNNTTFQITIDGMPFIFKHDGTANNSSSLINDCKLVLGEIEKDIVNRGNVVPTNIVGADATRGENNNYSQAEEYYGASHNVYIASLNARDQFAAKALQMLLAKTSKDPAGMSDDEMSHLSNVAYRWAANMMSAAANARASLVDTTESLEMSEAEIGSLDTTTDKLLNNIVVSLRKTDQKDGDVVSERVVNPTLNEILKEDQAKISFGSNGLGRDLDHPIYFYNTNERSDEDLTALIDERIYAWLSAARITITGPNGTFDATFDITFEDLDVAANLVIHTPGNN